MPDNPQTGLTQGDVQDLGGFSGGQDPLDAVKQSLVQRYQSLQPKPADGGPIRSLLQNFFSGAGNAMMKHVGLPTQQEQQEKVLSDLGAVTNAQGMADYHKAVASQYEMMDVPAPDGSTMQLPRKSAAQWMAANVRAQSGMTQMSEEMATAMGHPELAGQTVPKPLIDALGRLGVAQATDTTKQNIATQTNQTKAGIATQTNATRLKLGQIAAAAKVAVANNPTAQRANKADLAVNIQQNVNDLKSMIDSEPALFGKVAGRYTTVQQMMGSDDPTIARVGIAVHNAALANNSIHGIRSAEGALKTEQILLNHFRNGAGATKAALDEMARSAHTFIESAKLGKSAPSGGTVKQAATGNVAPEGTRVKVGNGFQVKRGGKWVPE